MSDAATAAAGRDDEPPPVGVVRALVAGHGDLAAGLVSAVAQITGQGGALLPLSNHDLSGEQLDQTLRELLARTGAALIFTDLLGGSWTIASRRVQRDLPALVVVTGVNLAMLLDFTFHGALSAEESGRVAVEKGRSAMAVIAGGSGGR